MNKNDRDTRPVGTSTLDTYIQYKNRLLLKADNVCTIKLDKYMLLREETERVTDAVGRIILQEKDEPRDRQWEAGTEINGKRQREVG